MKQVALTTVDNPFNIFEDFDHWFYFDIEKGYNTCGIVDRITHISEQMTEAEINAEVEQAIDEFIALDFTNTYKKVYSEEQNDA